MVPGMPGMPEKPGPNPQSCEFDYSQNREWGFQGCPSHFQEGQTDQTKAKSAQVSQPDSLAQHQCCGHTHVESIDSLSIISLQCFHCILTQQFVNLWW